MCFAQRSALDTQLCYPELHAESEVPSVLVRRFSKPRQLQPELSSRQPLLQIINVLPELAELTLLENDCDKSGEGKDDVRMHLLAFRYLELSHCRSLHSCGVQ
jgi:hypothetical protein